MFAWLVRLLGPQKSQRVEPPPKPKPVEIDPNAPVVNLSPDAMEITLCWPDPASLDLNRLIVALEDLPLELKLDEDALQAVLDRAAGGEDVLGEVLIAGQPVVQGHPGQMRQSRFRMSC